MESSNRERKRMEFEAPVRIAFMLFLIVITGLFTMPAVSVVKKFISESILHSKMQKAETVEAIFSDIKICQFFKKTTEHRNIKRASWVKIEPGIKFLIKSKVDWEYKGQKYSDSALVKKFYSVYASVNWLKRLEPDIDYTICFTDDYLLDGSDYAFVKTLQPGKANNFKYKLPINPENPSQHFLKKHLWDSSVVNLIVFPLVFLITLGATILTLRGFFGDWGTWEIPLLVLICSFSAWLVLRQPAKDYDKVYKMECKAALDLKRIHEANYLPAFIYVYHREYLEDIESEFPLNEYIKHSEEIERRFNKNAGEF